MAVPILPAGPASDFDPMPPESSGGLSTGTIDREWTLVDCGRTLYRRRVSVLCIAALGIAAAALASLLQTPMYQSSASIQILGLNENFLGLRDIYPTAAPGPDNAAYIQTQAEILRQDALIEQVVQELQLDQRPEFRNSTGPLNGPHTAAALERVKKNLRVVVTRGTSIIQIICASRDPKLAADLANTLAQAFIDQSIEARRQSAKQTQFSLSAERGNLERQLVEPASGLEAAAAGDRGGVTDGARKREADASRQFDLFIAQRIHEASVASAVDQSNARLVSPARPAAHPYKPNLLLNLLIGAIGGLVIAVGYVMLREQTRSAWRTPAEAAACLSVSALGTIPRVTAPRRFRLPLQGAAFTDMPLERASLLQPSSAVTESFRSAAASIFSAGGNGDHPRLLLFTSSRPGEGNTTVVSNLAIAFAETGGKVLVIDADLRRPNLHEFFEQPNSWGLSDLLREKNAVEELPLESLVKRTSVPRLYLLPGGSSADNVFPLLWSGRFARLLPRFRQGFDYVLIDTPACLEFTDARIIARHAETVVLVLRPDRTDREGAQSAVQRFQLDGTPVMGVILNAWDLS